MLAKTTKKMKNLLLKDFSDDLTDEILNMIDRLAQERTLDTDMVEKEITQHIMDHIQRDVKAAIKMRGGTVKAPFLKRGGPGSKAKGKK